MVRVEIELDISPAIALRNFESPYQLDFEEPAGTCPISPNNRTLGSQDMSVIKLGLTSLFNDGDVSLVTSARYVCLHTLVRTRASSSKITDKLQYLPIAVVEIPCYLQDDCLVIPADGKYNQDVLIVAAGNAGGVRMAFSFGIHTSPRDPPRGASELTL